MPFHIHEQISSSCIELGDWPLSRVLLKNNAEYPWLLLVPRVDGIQEINELTTTQRYQLMDEINALSTIVKTYFQPDKLNIATLGNIVSQLHVHVVARYQHDKLWPHSIWQAAQTTVAYAETPLAQLKEALSELIQQRQKLICAEYNENIRG